MNILITHFVSNGGFIAGNQIIPWYKTSWAILTCLLIIVCIVFLLNRLIIYQEKLKNQMNLERINREKVKEINKIKMDFFTTVSHEFKTPLSLLIDPLDKFIRGEISVDQAPGYYVLMKRNADRLLHMVNQLIDYRKFEEGKLKINIVRNDFILFLKNITGSFHFLAKQRNIRFVFQPQIASLPLHFDNDVMEKVFYNLISNAFKFTPDGGSIEIILQIVQDEKIVNKQVMEISIKDTGVGIPSESLPKIFDLFYQVNEPDNKYTEGTGLGLAMVKEMIAQHNGTITVESEVTKGSCFKIRLPLVDSINLIDTPLENKVDSSLNSGFGNKMPEIEKDKSSLQELEDLVDDENELDTRPLLLIVEDNPDVRFYLAEELSQTYRIIESNNGMNGYDKAVASIPDLIISDIMMPQSNGLELCKNVKTDERTSHIPVILLTARQSDEFKIAGYTIGADGYITKPFSIVTLSAHVKNIIESRQKLRDLYVRSMFSMNKKLGGNPPDEAFINKLVRIIQEYISDSDFNADVLAAILKMSRVQLYRKLKALTNKTVNDFIISVRLKKARELLVSTDMSISDIANTVGFAQLANFTREYINQIIQAPFSCKNK